MRFEGSKTCEWWPETQPKVCGEPVTHRMMATENRHEQFGKHLHPARDRDHEAENRLSRRIALAKGEPMTPNTTPPPCGNCGCYTLDADGKCRRPHCISKPHPGDVEPMIVQCVKCGVWDDTGMTPRTGSSYCDPHEWYEQSPAPPPEPEVCECGHDKDEHYHQVGCICGRCSCYEFVRKNATCKNCGGTFRASERGKLFCNECKHYRPTRPEPEVCECGHEMGMHPMGGGPCLNPLSDGEHGLSAPLCPCESYRPTRPDVPDECYAANNAGLGSLAAARSASPADAGELADEEEMLESIVSGSKAERMVVKKLIGEVVLPSFRTIHAQNAAKDARLAEYEKAFEKIQQVVAIPDILDVERISCIVLIVREALSKEQK